MPFSLRLQVLNFHPTLSAIGLSVQVDTADAFVWHGSRSVQVPEIPPGEKREMDMGDDGGRRFRVVRSSQRESVGGGWKQTDRGQSRGCEGGGID